MFLRLCALNGKYILASAYNGSKWATTVIYLVVYQDWTHSVAYELEGMPRSVCVHFDRCI